MKLKFKLKCSRIVVAEGWVGAIAAVFVVVVVCKRNSSSSESGSSSSCSTSGSSRNSSKSRGSLVIRKFWYGGKSTVG